MFFLFYIFDYLVLILIFNLYLVEMYKNIFQQQNKKKQKRKKRKRAKQQKHKRKAIPCFFTEKLKFIKKHLTCKL